MHWITKFIASVFIAMAIWTTFLFDLSAQNRQVSLDAKNQKIEQVLKTIEQETGYGFFYNNQQIDLERRVSVSVKNKDVLDVLSQVFKGTDVRCEISGDRIVLTTKSLEGGAKTGKKTISGKVVDSKGVPVVGAGIIEAGTSNGVITDTEGRFSIEVRSSDAVLEVSSIGYRSMEISAAQAADIVLQDDLQSLEEVVVIGYGTVKKSDLTGSVSSISTNSFKDEPVKRVEDALQGRTAGVAVTNVSGRPGGEIKIRVRGTTSINTSNDPLYVIDGMVAGGLMVNTDDIESIQVLKDASATAIYGSRGANGVILVTTKKGRDGAFRVHASADIGVSDIVKKYDLLNAYEYATALNAYRGSATISAEDMQAYKNGTKGIDWQNLMLRTGVSQDYRLSVSGGNDKQRYYISGGLINEKAMTIMTNYQRADVRVNLDNTLKDWLTLSTKVHGFQVRSHNGSVSIIDFLNYSPTMEMKDEETGVYNKDPFNAVDPNPYGKMNVNKSDSYNYKIEGSEDVNIRFFKGLTLDVQIGGSYMHVPQYSFTSSKVQAGQISDVENYSRTNTFWQITDNLTYDRTFGDHHLTATAVYETSKAETKGMEITGNNLQNEFVGYWNVQNASSRDGSNWYSAEAIESYLGRLIYSCKGKYMLTATLRADGSSKFQDDNKWGYFPSVAVAWDMSKENFMEKFSWLDQLKLRASFGKVGNQSIDAYTTLGMLAQTSREGYGSDTIHTGYWSGNLATPDVTWEKTDQYDLGLDASFLKNKVSFSFDWFIKDTKDLLLRKPIPNYNGGGTFWVNQGEVKNQGVEFQLSAYPLSSASGFVWETSFNASFVRNEILDLAGSDYIEGENNTGFGGGPITIMKVGKPLGSFYLYKWKGYNEEGANLYKRKSDGALTTNPTSDDLYVEGQAEPKWTFGWNNTLTWKNWTLNVFFNAAAGNNRLNMSRFAMASMIGKYRFITLADAYYKSWDQVADKFKAHYASHRNPDNKNYPDSDFWLEDASFIKLKNVSLTYTVPKSLTKSVDVQLSLSAQNLFTLTHYSGMDPEVYSSSYYDGVDVGAYPIARTFTFGLKLGF